MMMRIALCPDIHCYYSSRYDVLDKDGKSVRKEEWMHIAGRLYATCKRQKVDVLVAPGDFFVNPKPTAEQILLVSTMFSAFENAGIPVLGITGNHDIGGAGTTSMDKVVAEIGHNVRWCCLTFDTTTIEKDGEKIGFAFLPFVKAPQIAAYNPDFASKEMSGRLLEISQGLFEKLGDTVDKKILVGHWSIQGAVASSGKTMEATLSGIETVLPKGDLIRQGWDACMFGHIHVPQVLSDKDHGGPFIAYSGCFQRINIGEANDKRGFYIYDTKSQEYSFYELPAIEMKVFQKDIQGEADFDALLKEIKGTDLTGKYAYVKYTVDKDKFALVNKRAIEEAIRNQNPINIIGIMPKVIYANRQRDASVTETLDGEAALEKWLTNKEIPPERTKNLLTMYHDYVEELAESDT